MKNTELILRNKPNDTEQINEIIINENDWFKKSGERVNEEIMHHIHSLDNRVWKFSEITQTLYIKFELFNKEFFNDSLTIPVISIERMAITTLGQYYIERNGFGANNHIKISRHIVIKGEPTIVILSILLHEMIHQWQHEVRKIKINNYRNYHDVEFRLKASNLGIPCDQSGHTIEIRQDSPFVNFLRKNGLFEGTVGFVFNKAENADSNVEKVGSKLKKYSCGCTNIRVASKDFKAKCLNCFNEFLLIK